MAVCIIKSQNLRLMGTACLRHAAAMASAVDAGGAAGGGGAGVHSSPTGGSDGLSYNDTTSCRTATHYQCPMRASAHQQDVIHV